MNTLEKLSPAVAKGQLLTRRVKGRGIVNKVRRMRAQLAKGGHGERNEVEVCILQQRRVFRYLLPFLGTQRGPSQRLINTQMRREWVRNGDVNSNRLVVSPSCDKDVRGTLSAAHADVVLNGEASSQQEMRQLADNGFMPCCKFRFITTQNMVAIAIRAATTERTHHRLIAGAIQQLAQPPSPHHTTSRRRQLESQCLRRNSVQPRA